MGGHATPAASLIPPSCLALPLQIVSSRVGLPGYGKRLALAEASFARTGRKGEAPAGTKDCNSAPPAFGLHFVTGARLRLHFPVALPPRQGSAGRSAPDPQRQQGTAPFAPGGRQRAGSGGEETNRPVTPPFDISVVLACPRPKVVDKLMASLATFGVQRVLVVNAAKVESTYFDGKRLSRENLESDLVDGLMQGALYTRLPEVRVEKGLSLAQALERHGFCEKRRDGEKTQHPRMVAHPDAVVKARQFLCDSREGAFAGGQRPSVTIAVGPEGGWTEDELRVLEQRAGLDRVGLGPRILKTLDATLALLSFCYDAWE